MGKFCMVRSWILVLALVVVLNLLSFGLAVQVRAEMVMDDAVIVSSGENISLSDDGTGAVSSGDGYGEISLGVLTALAVGSEFVTVGGEFGLPSTGGIGTMVFYVVGSVMILGAIIFVIWRFRRR